MYILHFRVTSPANASDLPVAQSVPILKLDVGDVIPEPPDESNNHWMEATVWCANATRVE